MPKALTKQPTLRLTPAEKVDRIRQILYPGGDMDHEWDVGYLEDIARVVLDYDSKTGWISWPRK
jgi:hypothetical protein